MFKWADDHLRKYKYNLSTLYIVLMYVKKQKYTMMKKYVSKGRYIKK